MTLHCRNQADESASESVSRLSWKANMARWLISVVVFGAAAVPYVAGYLSSSEEFHFQGAVDYVEDVQSYFAWMRSAADSDGLPVNLYHTSPEKPGYFHLLWFGLGKVRRYTGISAVLLYHGSHAVAVILFLSVLWRFLGRFLADEKQRCIAFGVCALGSGFGRLTILHEPSIPQILRHKPLIVGMSMDLWSADVNTFYSMLVSPHFALALWMLVEIMDRLYRTVAHDDFRAWISGAVFTICLGFVHIYDLFVIAPLAVSFGVVYGWRKTARFRRILVGVAAFVISVGVPLLVYRLLMLRTPSLAAWSAQNVLSTPAPIWYLLGFGLPLILTLTYRNGWTRIRTGESDVLFLFLWVAVVLLLMYAMPVIPFAKRLTEGVHIPLVILGVRCLYEQWIPWIRERYQPSRLTWSMLGGTAAILILPTNLFLVRNMTIAATGHEAPYFLTGGEYRALNQLDRYADKDKGILSTEIVGNVIPRHTGMRVYAGHCHITPDWRKRRYLISKFMMGQMGEREIGMFFRENNIGYVWFGQETDQYRSRLPLESKEMELWYESGGVSLYKVH
ncbi:MAG TPA: hypothetical protein PKJ23_00890 [bacterium]|nr:hypothetical protein [bacterium]